ncbi:MAG: bifunctional 5,10-methylenetetrahydrofolate dehydrogenase/5,10-methenyltetrahydrofolate cyclohydrolase [Halobacteria archaeon]
MTEIDGVAVAEDVKKEVKKEVEEGLEPVLAAVLMSDDPASQTYVEMKKRDCEEVGIDSRIHDIDPGSSEEDLHELIEELNRDKEVDGVLVQAPLPDHVSTHEAFRAVDPEKDVDGFNPENKGLLMNGRPRFVPATPLGIQKLLDEYGVELEGKDVTIVGRSDIVGKPLANLLIQKNEGGNATVTVCHSRTSDLEKHVGNADVLVAATGQPEMIDASMVSEDTVVIDVGVNRIDADNEKGYKLVGDVDFDDVEPKVEAITPVPGGVGPMTRAMLLNNTVQAAKLQRDG